MDPIAEIHRGVEQLLGRASGPMHFRLIMQPIMAAALALKAGLKDAREGHPYFLQAFITTRTERGRLMKSAMQDLTTIFVVAVVLDIAYQAMVLRTFYPLQTVIVAFAVAVVPYVLLRGIFTRIARAVSKRAVSRQQ